MQIKNYISQHNKLTKIDSDCSGQCNFQAKHNGDQTEEHICHNHDNVLSVEAAYKPSAK